MKCALLGLSNNVSNNIQKIKVWSSSFKKHCDGLIILLCADSTAEELQMCVDLGIMPVPVSIGDTRYINHKRLEKTYQFLESFDKIDSFLVTDVFDVVFQGDPFGKMDLNSYDIFVSGEGVKVNQEPWNSDNIKKIFPYSWQSCQEQEVINSGIIGGKRLPLIKLFQTMYDLCELGSNDHNIKDQAALIIMVANGSIKNPKIFNLNDGWAMHCAVSGPTQFFEMWGFKNAIKYGIPKLEGDLVLTKSGQKYDMVHQFNRVPEWEKIIKNKYE